jgi:hypothetical protein
MLFAQQHDSNEIFCSFSVEDSSVIPQNIYPEKLLRMLLNRSTCEAALGKIDVII